jgi:flagellar M-ring protein FliF
LVAVTLWTQQADTQVLFANLAPDDAGAIVEKLKDLKVPYEIGAGGTSVLVPSAQVHDLRLQLASQGLPHGGGVGFEIFDRSSLGMSEFVQKLNYRRAIQGELARTIAQMPEVERARVHLAIPERRLFSAEPERPRASVILTVRGSHALSKTQVQGIVHLVASSVEGLHSKDVTVVDGHGQLLSGAAGEDSARLTGTQLEYQRSVEKDIETRIQSMLERIVGANKAVVRVSSIVDFRQVETTEERYDPNGQVVRSEQRSQEKAAGTNGVSGGVPGVASNVPPSTEAEPGQSSSNNSQTKNETVNYEVSRTVSKIVEPTGTIKKLSVAVLVDGHYESAGAEGEKTGTAEAARKYVPRSQEEMKQIEDIVKKAMGYQAERQDEVEVVSVQFRSTAVDEAGGVSTEAPTPAPFWTPYVRYAVGGVLFLLILFFVVRPLIAVVASGVSATTPTGNTQLPAPVGQVEASIADMPKPQILDMARSNPESTALVVKHWLKSEA